MAIIRAHIFISGRVQGVYFRSETQDMALSLGLTGWVKNLYDGRVEAVFEGEEKAVKEAVDWCKRGPRMAVVEKVDINWEKTKNDNNYFSISY
jgi:acylphosphatase